MKSIILFSAIICVMCVTISATSPMKTTKPGNISTASRARFPCRSRLWLLSLSTIPLTIKCSQTSRSSTIPLIIRCSLEPYSLRLLPCRCLLMHPNTKSGWFKFSSNIPYAPIPIMQMRRMGIRNHKRPQCNRPLLQFHQPVCV